MDYTNISEGFCVDQFILMKKSKLLTAACNIWAGSVFSLLYCVLQWK